MGEITLGMPGPWADDNYEVADHYTMKVGGLPDWPIPNFDIGPDMLLCRNCTSNLCLVAQVYAPISTLEERVIYVFGCSMPQCGSEMSSWRALRVQKLVSSEEMILPCHDIAFLPSSSHPALDNRWQDNLFTFDAREDDDGGSSDEIDIEELSRAFSEVASLSPSSKKQTCDSEAPAKPSTADRKCKLHDKRFTVLPCFYMYSQEEKYLKVKPMVSKSHSLSSDHNELDSDDHSLEEAWEGESYEYDKALNADRTYLKFKKRIDANPEQCLRYSYGGRPLMASLTEGDCGSCSLCGGPRQYEMQLMPPLLYFLQEAASGDQKDSLQNWNWLTLIIYTCSASCTGSSLEDKSDNQGWVVAEEAVVVQFE